MPSCTKNSKLSLRRHTKTKHVRDRYPIKNENKIIKIKEDEDEEMEKYFDIIKE